MRDLRGALAVARKNIAKTSGNTGNSGNTFGRTSEINALDEGRAVSAAAGKMATVATSSARVASVATTLRALATCDRQSKHESEQSLNEPVATVSSVSTENQHVREISEGTLALRRWREGMASFQGSFAPCPGFSAEKWVRVRSTASQFLNEFGEQASVLGWTDLDLFGVHPEVGLVRTDCSGALMLSNGRRVVAVSECTIAYEDKLTFYRKPARERGPSVTIWEFGSRHGCQGCPRPDRD